MLSGAGFGLGASCERRPPQRPSPAPAQTQAEARERPSLTLYFLTDLDGYLEPCGCQTRPLGGIDRVAQAVSSARGHAPTSLFVAAGDIFFEHPTVEDRMVFQERERAQTIARVLDSLNLAAYAPGPADFALGPDTWRALSSSLHATALAANAGMSRSIIREVSGLRVGIIGVSDFASADGQRVHGAPEATDPITAVRGAISGLRGRDVSLVVVLASVSQRTARAIAAEIPGIDIVVAARHEGSAIPPPERIGTAYIVTTPNQAKALGAIDLWLNGRGPLADMSDASATAARERLDARIRELDTRLAAWSRDPHVDPAAVATQRTRLESLRAERAALDHRPSPSSGRFFSARTIEMSPEVTRDTSVQAQLGVFFSSINEHNRQTYATLRAPPAPAGTAHYVGVNACRGCHQDAYNVWARTPHHSAYRTLELVSKNYNLSCVGCHVTGYRQPGGSEVVQNEGLRDVQCESCHGPGSLHVAATTPALRQSTIRREVPGSFCASECHTPEHSDHFDYTTYLPRILGPGHGLPLAPPPSGNTTAQAPAAPGAPTTPTTR